MYLHCATCKHDMPAQCNLECSCCCSTQEVLDNDADFWEEPKRPISKGEEKSW